MDLLRKKVDIVGVSDVSLGYGSPQILALMQSLAKYYQTEALIIEPDQVNRKPVMLDMERCEVKRISQVTDPHTTAGRQEYIIKAAHEINRYRPSLLVVFCTYSLPVLYKLKYRPKFVLYSSLESIEAYGPLDIDLNCTAAKKIDAIIFPEENRARLDSARCELFDIPSVILYNAVNDQENLVERDLKGRNGRILYSGTIDYERTLAKYFLEKEVQSLPIDLFGTFSGGKKEEVKEGIRLTGKNLRYKGYIEARKLNELRKNYAFSLVMWAPTNENQLYACPNKFFDAIADGVPPIITPHPQAEMLVNRYECGIVMQDWSFKSFLRAVRQALNILDTERYETMVENCHHAVMQELNWETQFSRLVGLLPEKLGDR